MENLKRRLEELKPLKILDVGTGTGNFINELNTLYKGKYIGVDTHERSIEMAKERFKKEDNISFLLVDEKSLGFDAESFDLVCLSNTIHHLTNEEDMFKEMMRVLKPGGFLLINEMQSDQLNAQQKSHMILHHFAAKIDRLQGVEHKDTFTRDEILSILNKWGSVELIEEDLSRDDEMSKEEFNWFKDILERIVGRVKEHDKYDELLQESKEVLKYIEENGYDRATTVIALIQKD